MEQPADMEDRLAELFERVEALEEVETSSWDRLQYLKVAADLLIGSGYYPTSEIFSIADRIAEYCNKRA